MFFPSHASQIGFLHSTQHQIFWQKLIITLFVYGLSNIIFNIKISCVLATYYLSFDILFHSMLYPFLACKWTNICYFYILTIIFHLPILLIQQFPCLCHLRIHHIKFWQNMFDIFVNLTLISIKDDSSLNILLHNVKIK